MWGGWGREGIYCGVHDIGGEEWNCGGGERNEGNWREKNCCEEREERN